MAPYSLSACQVVRVFCAVLRALGASPILSLGIVFLTGYPTCARPPAPFWFLRARATLLLKDFLEDFSSQPPHTKQPWRDGIVPCATRQPPGFN
eukprot:scaffold28480_cov67-Skeletonema_dohrnii-CCMP3373.AAC.1